MIPPVDGENTYVAKEARGRKLQQSFASPSCAGHQIVNPAHPGALPPRRFLQKLSSSTRCRWRGSITMLPTRGRSTRIQVTTRRTASASVGTGTCLRSVCWAARFTRVNFAWGPMIRNRLASIRRSGGGSHASRCVRVSDCTVRGMCSGRVDMRGCVLCSRLVE